VTFAAGPHRPSEASVTSLRARAKPPGVLGAVKLTPRFLNKLGAYFALPAAPFDRR
jgi:hypothetical protein